MKRFAFAPILLCYLFGGQQPATSQAWQHQAPDTNAVSGQVSRAVWVSTQDGEATLVLTCFSDANPILQLRLYSPRHVFDFHSDAQGKDRVRLTWRSDTDADNVNELNAPVFKDGRNAFLFEFETVSSRRIVRSSHESIDPLTGEVIVETDSSAQQLLFGLVTDMRPHTLALKWPVAFEADQTARWRLRPNAALRAIVAACQG